MSGPVGTDDGPGLERHRHAEEETVARRAELVPSRAERQSGPEDGKSTTTFKGASRRGETSKPSLSRGESTSEDRSPQQAEHNTDQASKRSASSAEPPTTVGTHSTMADNPFLASQEPEDCRSPVSPRLHPIASFPDAHGPEPTVPSGVAAGMHHAYVVPALEPVAEETAKPTAVERIVGEAYHAEVVECDKAKTVDRGVSGRARLHSDGWTITARASPPLPSEEQRHSLSTAPDGPGMSGTDKGIAVDRDDAPPTTKPGHRHLHAFEEINTIKARNQASPPPSPAGSERTRLARHNPAPSSSAAPSSSPPLTHAPLDRTTSRPARPPTPSRTRREQPRNRAQHTEFPALGAEDAQGTYHEAEVGGMTFTQQGRVWIGRPPASLDGVAMRMAWEREAALERERIRQAEMRGTARTGSATVEAAAAAATTVAPLRMLPLMPRFLFPRLTLDFQWSDSWLPADVRLETTAHPSAPGHTISLSQSLRQWVADTAAPPRHRRIRHMDTRRKE